MAVPVHDSDDGYEVRQHPVDHKEWKLSWQSHAGLTIDDRKDFRSSGNQAEAGVNAPHELCTQSNTTPFIPNGRFRNVGFRLVSDDDRQAHRLARIRSRAIFHGVLSFRKKPRTPGECGIPRRAPVNARSTGLSREHTIHCRQQFLLGKGLG